MLCVEQITNLAEDKTKSLTRSKVHILAYDTLLKVKNADFAAHKNGLNFVFTDECDCLDLRLKTCAFFVL